MALKPVGQPTTAPTAPTAERFTPEYFAGLGRSALQGISFGTADEAEAFVRSLIGEETYKQERDKIRAGLEKFRSDFPVEAYGTEIAASIPSGVGLARTLGKYGVKGAMKQAGIGGAAYGAGAAEEMEDVPVGAALGGALGMGGEALAPVVSRQAQALGKKIPLTVGQYFPGMKRAEEALTSMPFVGGGIRAQQERGMKAFPVFMYNRALKPLGIELPKNTEPRVAFSKAKSIFDQKYKQALDGVEVDVSDDLLDDLSKIVTTAKQEVGDAGLKKGADFENMVIRQVLGRAKDGKLSGEAIQDIQKKIGAEAMRFGKSTDPIDGKIATAYSDLDIGMMDLIAKYSPAKKELLQKTNKAYSQFVPLRSAAAKGYEGQFTPAQAMSAVRSEERKAGAAGLSRLAAGEGRMQKPIELAQRIIGPSLPDSGTAGRMLTGAALYGGGGALVGAPGGMSTEGAMLGLAGGMLGRGATTRGGQAFLKRAAIPAAAAGLRAPATSGLLAQQVRPMVPQAQASSLEDMAAGGNIVGYETVMDRQGNPVTFAKTSDGRAVRVR
jgi:hypothetical protein